MKFGLFFFGFGGRPAQLGEPAYSPIIDAARFADRNSLAFVSTPECHFTTLGGMFPNPALTGAAIAAGTNRVQIRAGSLLLPLVDPVRLVEDWLMLDVMSGGRVAMGFTPEVGRSDPGHPVSAGRADGGLARQLGQVRDLWRTRRAELGDAGGEQAATVTLFPEPVTLDVPLWIDVDGAGAGFAEAGRLGVNVLTGLGGRDLADLAAEIGRYRNARATAGFADRGVVTVLQPTYLSDAPGDLRAALGDLERHLGQPDLLDPCDGRAMANHSAGSAPPRYRVPRRDLGGGLPAAVVGSSVTVTVRPASRVGETPLVGSVSEAAHWVRALDGAGVDEVACVVDFVDDPDLLRRGLPGIAALNRACGDDATGGVRAALDRFMGWG